MAIWFANPTIDDAQRQPGGPAARRISASSSPELGDDFLRGTMPVEPRTRQPMGYLHGGASLVLAETLGSVAANYVRRSREVPLPRPGDQRQPSAPGVRTDWSSAPRAPFHLGARSQVWSIEIRDPAERLVCIRVSPWPWLNGGPKVGEYPKSCK